MKHLLAISDLSYVQLIAILDHAEQLKTQLKNGEPHPLLQDKTLGMIFAKSSTRTRVSFEVGMYQLGGHALCLNTNDLQLGRGESIYDTAKVLSRYVNGIMIRTFKHSDVEELAQHATIPVINGLTDDHHPCQILADLLTIREHKGTLKGLKLAYIGDGNNVCNSLLQGCAIVGMHLSVAAPAAYAPCQSIVDGVKSYAERSGSVIEILTDPVAAVANADVVYTDTWVSMGQDSEREERIQAFMPYQVNGDLLSHVKSDAIFMHDLPAYRGYEATDEVMDAPYSVIFDQAENRLHAQKAVLAYTFDH